VHGTGVSDQFLVFLRPVQVAGDDAAVDAYAGDVVSCFLVAPFSGQAKTIQRIEMSRLKAFAQDF